MTCGTCQHYVMDNEPSLGPSGISRHAYWWRCELHPERMNAQARHPCHVPRPTYAEEAEARRRLLGYDRPLPATAGAQQPELFAGC